MPPPDAARTHPAAPMYWMDETSGKLALAVGLLVTQPQALTLLDIAYIRAYFRQWIESPAWDMNPERSPEGEAALALLRGSVNGLVSLTNIRSWLRVAVEWGLDPL